MVVFIPGKSVRLEGVIPGETSVVVRRPFLEGVFDVTTVFVFLQDYETVGVAGGDGERL
jgi:hypothetical protein